MPSTRIGVCSWSLQPQSPHELVSGLQESGLNSVQLALGSVIDDPETWGGVIDTLQPAGIRIASGMMATAGEDYSTLDSIARTGGIRPDETWEANRALAKKLALVAGGAGIKLVTFHAGFLPERRDDPEREKLLGRLREVADLFGDEGVGLAFETGQETAATLLEVLDDLDRPEVGVNFDPANMILYAKGDPVEALKMLAPRVKQIHIKDALPSETPGEWGTEVPAGEGAVDWDAFFEVAMAIMPEVNFIIEREAGESRGGDIVKARQLIQKYTG